NEKVPREEPVIILSGRFVLRCEGNEYIQILMWARQQATINLVFHAIHSLPSDAILRCTFRTIKAINEIRSCASGPIAAAHLDPARRGALSAARRHRRAGARAPVFDPDCLVCRVVRGHAGARTAAIV